MLRTLSLRRAARGTAAVLAVAAATVVPSALTPMSASAAVPGTVANCTPYELPSAPGGGGQVMWITDSGLYVGAQIRPDWSAQAGWWTHAGSDLSTGWTFHAIAELAGMDSEVLDANTAGVMVGFVYGNGPGAGFVYDSNTSQLTWLPNLPGGHGIGYSRRINASGVVAGGAIDRQWGEVAVTWAPPYTAAHKLPDVGASQSVGTQQYKNSKMFSEADGINDAGDTAGTTSLGGPIDNTSELARNGQLRGGIAPLFIAMIWHTSGVQRLPAGEAQSIGFAINNAGTVVGESDRPGDPNYDRYPAAWRNGKLIDLGASPDVVWGRAYGISQGGWAVGGVAKADDSARGFVWTGTGSLQELPPLPGDDNTWAHGADDQLGQLGGSSWSGDGFDRATVWQCPGGFTTG